jgi:hypothetical protein
MSYTKNRFEVCYNFRELNAQTIKGAINHTSLITDFRISPQIKNPTYSLKQKQNNGIKKKPGNQQNPNPKSNISLKPISQIYSTQRIKD